jgi:ribosomal protein S18 acetylase RimI-like enzyme
MVDMEFFADAATFAAVVRPLAQADPVGATIFSSVLEGQIAAPFPGEPPLLVTATAAGRVLAAALRIPRYPMTVVVDPEIADPAGVLGDLAAAVIAGGECIVGLGGRRRTVELVAAQWAARTGVTPKLRMPLLFHRLGTLTPPDGVSGAPRTASMRDQADVDLLARWWFEFEHETGANAHAASTAPDPDVVLSGAARGQVVIIWSDGERAVAAAGHTAVRDGSARIAPVYTPPEFRRCGYGSAVTTAAVRSAQALGATNVSLFTDAEYMPANAVYRSLGFQVVAEFAEFEIPGAAAGS